MKDLIYIKPKFLECIEVENTSAENLMREVNFRLQKYAKEVKDLENFRLLVTDRASSCLKLGRLLREYYPNLIHVTCLCHALHNISEYIRKKCAQIDRFI